MKKIRIGGVPEHFNLPWHFAIEQQFFSDENIDLQWQDFPGGTGAMCLALRNGEIDLAVILTEGIVKDIAAGNPSKIVKIYVETPLLWGVHVGANSHITSVNDLNDATAAISRFGSGSHLMAKVMAQKKNLDKSSLSYEIINDLKGALAVLPENHDLFFMWEYFMTKPYVDDGTFRRIDTVETPWPCFVIAARDELLENDSETVKNTIAIINTVLKKFNTPSFRTKTIPVFAEKYGLEAKDVYHWSKLTQWNTNKKIDVKQLDNIITVLHKYEVISEKIPLHNLVYNL